MREMVRKMVSYAKGRPLPPRGLALRHKCRRSGKSRTKPFGPRAFRSSDCRALLAVIFIFLIEFASGRQAVRSVLLPSFLRTPD